MLSTVNSDNGGGDDDAANDRDKAKMLMRSTDSNVPLHGHRQRLDKDFYQ